MPAGKEHILLSASTADEIIEFVKEKELKIREILPDTWTHVANLNPLQIGFHLKLTGLDYRSEQEYAALMGLFQHLGMLQLSGMLIRRSSHPLFHKEQK